MLKFLKNKTQKNYIYLEHYWVPFWWWGAVVGIIAIFMYNLKLGYDLSNTTLLILGILLTIISFCFLMNFSAKTLSISPEGILYCGGAQISLNFFSKILVITPQMHSSAMGNQLDPSAFVVHHFWIKSMVLLVLSDADDPTPYWLISTRNPQKLIQIVSRFNSDLKTEK